MRCLILSTCVCLAVNLVWASSAAETNVCSAGCTCEDAADTESSVTKHEGLAAAVGALTPLVVGVAGLGLYKVFRASGSSPGLPGTDGPDLSSPRPQMNRSSVPSYMDSPGSYRGTGRDSTPVSMFAEDDDISFNDSASRPDTTSNCTNIHRARKSDAVNRWM